MSFRARPSALGTIMSPAKKPGELSAGCITYLKRWLADDFYEDIDSKYTRKGKLKEAECIDFASRVLNLGMCFKNNKIFENDYLIGEPDTFPKNAVLDTKCAWSMKTLMDVSEEPNKDYEAQIRGYMWLCDKPTGIVFHGLLDTPEEANYGRAVSWEHLPEEKRWVAYQYKRDESYEQLIRAKVLQCREWIDRYTSSMGKLVDL